MSQQSSKPDRAVPPIIGVRIPSWATFARNVPQGIVEFLRASSTRWTLQIDSENNHELPPVSINARWRGDALITFRISKAELKAFQKRGIPVINISSESADLDVHSVLPDNHQAGEFAADYLTRIGMPNFAFWGDARRAYSQEREKGFADRLREAGKTYQSLDCDVYALAPKERWKTLGAQMRKQLKTLPTPIGLFAKDDLAARALVAQCEGAGLRVPDDIAILGFNDDVIFCHAAYPPISSVSYPGRRIGHTAAAGLASLLDGGELPRISRIHVTDLEERESTNTLVFEDEVVGQVVTFIRRDACTRALKVSEVIDRFPISRSSLQAKFQRVIGKSPKELIAEVRLHRLKTLLEKTDLQIKEISYEMGFKSVEELGRFFKRMQGMSAGEHRANARGKRRLR